MSVNEGHSKKLLQVHKAIECTVVYAWTMSVTCAGEDKLIGFDTALLNLCVLASNSSSPQLELCVILTTRITQTLCVNRAPITGLLLLKRLCIIFENGTVDVTVPCVTVSQIYSGG